MFGRTKDPVCGMKLSQRFARVRTGYHGKMLYFCSVTCKTRFEAEPERWLQKGSIAETQPGVAANR